MVSAFSRIKFTSTGEGSAWVDPCRKVRNDDDGVHDLLLESQYNLEY